MSPARGSVGAAARKLEESWKHYPGASISRLRIVRCGLVPQGLSESSPVRRAGLAFRKSNPVPDGTIDWLLALAITAGYRFLILLQRAGHEILELADTRRIGRVGRHQFRRLLAVLCFHHPFPKRYRLPRIVAGPRHILEADLIRFKFVLSAEGQ